MKVWITGWLGFIFILGLINEVQNQEMFGDDDHDLISWFLSPLILVKFFLGFPFRNIVLNKKNQKHRIFEYNNGNFISLIIHNMHRIFWLK